MVQFLSIIFFLGFLQFLLAFSKVPVFLCHPVYCIYTVYIHIISAKVYNYVNLCSRNCWRPEMSPWRRPELIGTQWSLMGGYSESVIWTARASCDSASRIADGVSVLFQEDLHYADLKMEQCQKRQDNMAPATETEVSKPPGREK